MAQRKLDAIPDSCKLPEQLETAPDGVTKQLDAARTIKAYEDSSRAGSRADFLGVVTQLGYGNALVPPRDRALIPLLMGTQGPQQPVPVAPREEHAARRAVQKYVRDTTVALRAVRRLDDADAWQMIEAIEAGYAAYTGANQPTKTLYDNHCERTPLVYMVLQQRAIVFDKHPLTELSSLTSFFDELETQVIEEQRAQARLSNNVIRDYSHQLCDAARLLAAAKGHPVLTGMPFVNSGVLHLLQTSHEMGWGQGAGSLYAGEISRPNVPHNFVPTLMRAWQQWTEVQQRQDELARMGTGQSAPTVHEIAKSNGHIRPGTAEWTAAGGTDNRIPKGYCIRWWTHGRDGKQLCTRPDCKFKHGDPADEGTVKYHSQKRVKQPHTGPKAGKKPRKYDKYGKEPKCNVCQTKGHWANKCPHRAVVDKALAEVLQPETNETKMVRMMTAMQKQIDRLNANSNQSSDEEGQPPMQPNKKVKAFTIADGKPNLGIDKLDSCTMLIILMLTLLLLDDLLQAVNLAQRTWSNGGTKTCYCSETYTRNIAMFICLTSMAFNILNTEILHKTVHGIHKRLKALAVGSGQEQTRASRGLCFDSGANVCVESQRCNFHSLKQSNKGEVVLDAGGKTHAVAGYGKIKYLAKDTAGIARVITFKDVHWIPTMTGAYIDPTTLRLRQNWAVSGDRAGLIWRTPEGHRFKLRIHEGNEYLHGEYLTPKNEATAQKRVQGFISDRFKQKIAELDTEKVQDLLEKRTDLNRWERHHVAVRLAKAGVYPILTDRAGFLEAHARMGHPAFAVTAQYLKNHNYRFPGIGDIRFNDLDRHFCEACLKAKSQRKPKGKRVSNPRPPPMTKFSSDVYGPLPVAKFSGHKYVLWFVDQGSQSTWSYCIEHLREIPQAISRWIHEIRSELEQNGVERPQPIQIGKMSLRTDSASYYTCRRTQEIMQREKVQLTFSPPNTQSRNGYAEASLAAHAKQTLAILEGSGMGQEYWPLAWQYCQHVRDHTPRGSRVTDPTPYQARGGKGASELLAISTHAFGQDCYQHVQKQDRGTGKIVSKARPAKFVGFDKTNGAYKIITKSEGGRTILRSSAHVTFKPTYPSTIYDPAKNRGAPIDPTMISNDCHDEEPCEAGDVIPDPIEIQTGRGIEQPSQNDAMVQNDSGVTPTYVPGVAAGDAESEVVPQPIDTSADQAIAETDGLTMSNGMESGTVNLEAIGINPETGEPQEDLAPRDDEGQVLLQPGEIEVLSGGGFRVGAIMAGARPRYSLKSAMQTYPLYDEQLRNAAIAEVEGLIEKCLEPVEHGDIQPNEVVSQLLTIYTIKYEAKDGELVFDKAKCRACYRGNSEQYGLDWIAKASHLPKVSTVRLFFAFAPIGGATEVIAKCDISQAFLRADIQTVPEGRKRRLVRFPIDISPRDKSGRPMVYKATKSIYGMTAAARQWWLKLTTFLRSIGLRQSEHDPAYFWTEGLRVLCWTDDLPHRGTPAKCAWLQQVLEKEYGDVRYEKDCQYVLGLSIHRDSDGWLGLSQEAYVDTMIESHQMITAKGASTPLPPKTVIHSDQRSDTDQRTKRKYQQGLGMAAYLSNWTMCPAMYATSALGTVASGPTPSHQRLLRHLMRWMKANRQRGLKWSPPTDLSMTNKIAVYSDASLAREEGYRSQGALIVMCNGNPVHWKSQRQPFPALSSTESEIIAGTEALRHLLYMQGFMNEIGETQPKVTLYFDSQNAIRFAKAEGYQPRNLHIGTRYRRIKYHEGREVSVAYVPTTQCLPDVGTKATEADQFERIVDQISHNFEQDAHSDGGESTKPCK